MRSLERHRDAGAYALGVLDEADTFRFEDHLVDCAHCRARLSELALPTRLLKTYGGSVPYAFDPAAAVPGPRLLDRLLDETGRVRRVRRRRWVGAVAAGVVLAVVGPAAAVMSAGGGEDGALRVAARDGRSGMAAVVTARGRAWGTEVGLRVRDPGRGRACELVAVGTDGSRDVVTTWRAPGRAMETTGGTGLRPERIDHFEVRATDGGKHLLTLRPR
ncbi:membrane protein [Streptomyces aureoverticillatus]|nr:membrane protein [Streptomyces aureoverticillatus]